ncbi:hypothetical protein WOLCODRAFT_153053 [Wolfiporia cocos MD-104 SS10]|uniref:Uncharacterized protein n=1 Tax=Wolfiporia cocos (strain MD-104) TaxID=742152 RepID=A0A2H3JSV8_WOLCO|nr:hypothetical protein WOLCODRAFT_153053 [Wolfiporia cocos MD-104 SS10]
MGSGEDQQQHRKSGWLEKLRSTWAPVLGGEEEQPPAARRDVQLYSEEAQAEGRAQEKQRMATRSRKASKAAAGTVAYDDGGAGLAHTSIRLIHAGFPQDSLGPNLSSNYLSLDIAATSLRHVKSNTRGHQQARSEDLSRYTNSSGMLIPETASSPTPTHSRRRLYAAGIRSFVYLLLAHPTQSAQRRLSSTHRRRRLLQRRKTVLRLRATGKVAGTSSMASVTVAPSYSEPSTRRRMALEPGDAARTDAGAAARVVAHGTDEFKITPTNSPPRSAHWPPVLDLSWALHRALVANFHRSGFTVLGPDGEALQYEDIWDNIADGLSSLFDSPPGDGEPLDQPAASPTPEPAPAPLAPSNESPLTPLSHFSDTVAAPSSPRSELSDFDIPEPQRPATSTQTIIQRPVQYPVYTMAAPCQMPVHLEHLFTLCAVIDEEEKKQWVVRYAPIDKVDLFEVLPAYSPGTPYADFKKAVYDLYPGTDDERKCIANLAGYHRDFLTITTFLISKNRISAAEQGRAFARGFQPALWARILQRLELKDPDHYPDDPYVVDEIHCAATFVLHGTQAGTSPAATSSAPATATDGTTVKVETIQSLIDAFTKTMQTFVTATSTNASGSRPAPAPQHTQDLTAHCHYCGDVNCMVGTCRHIEEDMRSGKVRRNSEGKVVLPNGSFVPRSIPGITIRDRVYKWHRRNPGSGLLCPSIRFLA